MGLRMKNCEGSLKNPIFRWGHAKPMYSKELPKKGELGQFAGLRGHLAKKRGGWYPNIHYVQATFFTYFFDK